MSRASLDKEPHAVAQMFDGVAEHYDRTNSILGFGLDRYWRATTRGALGLASGEKVLDVAAGTSVSTVALAKSGAWCVAADFSLGMLRRGLGRPVPKVAADALRLPFADGAFDAVTVSFGLRNMQDTVAALRELRRVVRPGGRLVVCEFSTPSWGPLRTLYRDVVLRALPFVARRVASNAPAYVYLPESILGWYGQRELADLITQAGWSRVGWRDLTGGVVALHRAVNPVIGHTGSESASGT